MKDKVLSICIIIVLSCSCSTNPKNLSLEPLKVENIDNIPYLMRKMNIDSVFEIIKTGKPNNLIEGDTLSTYFTDFEDSNIIHQRIKGLWCCKNTYVFDSLHFLISKTITSDYSFEIDYTWVRNKNKIYGLDHKNEIDSSNFYILDGEKPITKILLHPNDDGVITDTTKFEYNKLDQIVRITQNVKNPSSTTEYAIQKIKKNYQWSGEQLKKIIKRRYKINQEKNEIIQIDTTTLDDFGFPESNSTIIFKEDTVIKIKTYFKYIYTI